VDNQWAHRRNCRASTSDQWPTVHTLVFAPRLHGAAVDVAGIGPLALFLGNEARAGHIDEAIAHLERTCTTLAEMDKNLRVKASNKLKPSVAEILRRAKNHHYDALARLVDLAPDQTSKQLIHGMLDSPLFAERAREFGSNLSVIPRVIGIGPFPEVLVPASPPIPPAEVTDSATNAPTGEGAAAQTRARHAAQVILTLDTCTREFEAATLSAYEAIRKHTAATNDDAAARAFSEATGFLVSESTVYRLKVGTYWVPPSQELCETIDKYTAARGTSTDLTKKHATYIAAKQASDDLKNARR
jgi:hypothetical protein